MIPRHLAVQNIVKNLFNTEESWISEQNKKYGFLDAMGSLGLVNAAIGLK